MFLCCKRILCYRKGVGLDALCAMVIRWPEKLSINFFLLNPSSNSHMSHVTYVGLLRYFVCVSQELFVGKMGTCC